MKVLQPLLIFMIALEIFSCTKHYPQQDNATATGDNLNGMFYINAEGMFIKLNPASDSIYWTSEVLSLANSYHNPIAFDSSYFYFGNYNSLFCYSANAGLPVWSFSWYAFNDAITYREPAFKDSLIFFTSPTSMWDNSYLFCKNKVTGKGYWSQQIDNGYVSIGFNSIPVVYNNKVITLTRDQNNHKYITAYSVQNGALQWSTAVGDSTSSKLWVTEGKICSAYGSEAICLNASTGQFLWKTKLDIPSSWFTYNFIEDGKLVIVKVLSNSSYKILRLEIGNGTLISLQTIDVPTTYASNPQHISPVGCCYGGNKLYIASFYSFDSLDIFSYNLQNEKRLWQIRLPASIQAEQAPLLTDKYVIFPINNNYNGPSLSYMVFLDLSGKLVKKLPFKFRDTNGFVYKENGVTYTQPPYF